jgi:hypothetical protein
MLTPSIHPRALIVCALLFIGAPAFAQYRPRPAASTSPAENYHVELSAGFWNPSADMQIIDGLAGSTIDLKKDLGLADKKLPEYQVVIKPALKHKIRVQFIPISFTQTGTPTRDLTFSGQTYSAGSAITSTLEWKAWRFGYEYDMVSTARGFLGVIVDLKYTDVGATLNASGRTGTASAKAPIPALGGIGRVYLASNLSTTIELTGFNLPGGWIKTTSGHYADMDTYAMLNFADSFSVKGGYRKFDVAYTLTNDSGTFKLDGWYVGAALRF